MLSKSRIEEEIEKMGILPPKIVFYTETDSTNSRAREYAIDNKDDKSTVVFIADSQTKGRGRRGRSFISNKGAGIYVSILTHPDEKGVDATKTTARTAVALSRAIESLCECDVKIKWVNDLYLGSKKLAGILTEAEMREDGKIAYQVVGMGINVYKSAISDEISDIATSLESELNCTPDRSQLVARIIAEFLRVENDVYTEYKSRSIVIDREVEVIKLSESYRAKVLNINPDYSLKLERNGMPERLFTGEISLKL